MLGGKGLDQCRLRARVRVVAQITKRIGLHQRPLVGVAGDSQEARQRLGLARARGGESRGSLNHPRPPSLGPPLRQHLHRPRGGPRRVALGAGVGNAERHGVLGRRQADRVITNLRLDAEDRARHVALDARASGTRGLVPGVLGQRRSNRRVTRRAQRVVGGRQLRVTIDVGEVRVVTRRAGRAALQEAAALPQADRVVREASRPAIRPVDRVLFLARRVFELGHEVVVVVLAGAVTGLHGVAERMALRAHHAARGRIESRRSDDGSAGGGGRRSRGLRATCALPGP